MLRRTVNEESWSGPTMLTNIGGGLTARTVDIELGVARLPRSSSLQTETGTMAFLADA